MLHLLTPICIKDLGKLESFDGNHDFFELELYE